MTATARVPATPALSVLNHAWCDDAPLTDLERLWDPSVPARLSGQYALHAQRGGEHLLVRDALGVNKLFFAIDDAGVLQTANTLVELRRAGHPIDRIFSVPSGHTVRVRPAERFLQLQKVKSLPFGENGDASDIAPHATRIRARLEETFARVAQAVRGRPVYVTLSGGLDSTAVAALAREAVGRVTGLTFCLGDESRARVPGADLFYAQKVADELGIPLEVVCVQPADLLRLVDPVLLYGQDWRDFNVHCGVVNAALGEALARKHAGGPRPVVLTGDTMNELMADYSPVLYRGVEYYSLPRLPAGRLRRFLVGGLDAGDREVGVFHAFGVDTIEPYAWCADAYTALPGAFVEQKAAKQMLVEQVLGARIPRLIYERPKVRAQVGSSAEVGGTLACLVDQGVDSRALAARFCALLDIDPQALGSLIRAGFYRFTARYPGGSA